MVSLIFLRAKLFGNMFAKLLKKTVFTFEHLLFCFSFAKIYLNAYNIEAIYILGIQQRLKHTGPYIPVSTNQICSNKLDANDNGSYIPSRNIKYVLPKTKLKVTDCTSFFLKG